jgi:hypothetical protein
MSKLIVNTNISAKRKNPPNTFDDIKSLILSGVINEREKELIQELAASVQTQINTLKRIRAGKDEKSAEYPGKGPLEFRASFLKTHPRFKDLAFTSLSFCLWNETDDETDSQFRKYYNRKEVEPCIKKQVTILVAFVITEQADEEFHSLVSSQQGYSEHWEVFSKIAAHKYNLPNPDNWFYGEEMCYGGGQYFYNENELEDDQVQDVDAVITPEFQYSPHIRKFYPLFLSESEFAEHTENMNDATITPPSTPCITIEVMPDFNRSIVSV